MSHRFLLSTWGRSTTPGEHETTPLRFSRQATILGCRSKLVRCGGGSVGWSRSCDQLLDRHVFGSTPCIRAYTVIGDGDTIRLISTARMSSWVRAVAGPLGKSCAAEFSCGQWRHLDAKLPGGPCQ